MAATTSKRPRRTRHRLRELWPRMHRHDWAVPVAVAVGAAVVGAVVAEVADWGAEERFAAALGAGVIGVLLHGRILARRQAEATAVLAGSAAKTTAATAAGTIDARLGSLGLGVETGDVPTSSLGLHPRKVVVLSGHSRSGKSRIADALAEVHPDWAHISCGAFVRAEAQTRGLSTDRETTDQLGQTLVKELGGDGFVDAVLQHAEIGAEAETLVIDDVYHVPVYEAIQRRWDHLQFVWVDLPASVRLALEARQAKAAPESELDRAAHELEKRHKPARVLEGAPHDDPRQIRRRARQLSDFIAQPA